MSLQPEEQEALDRGWPCDYCGQPMSADNIIYSPGKSDITAHRTCFEQVQQRMGTHGWRWGENWKPTPPTT